MAKLYSIFSHDAIHSVLKANKPDPDADYDEDYGDELDIPDESLDEDDFDD